MVADRKIRSFALLAFPHSIKIVPPFSFTQKAILNALLGAPCDAGHAVGAVMVPLGTPVFKADVIQHAHPFTGAAGIAVIA
jgi:hypothetical protein